MPISVAFAILAVSIWLVRSIPRTLALTAVASLLAFALMPVVEALRRRTGWNRRYAAAAVLVGTGVIAITTIVLVAVPTIDQVRRFNKDVPKTVDQLGDSPDHRAAPARGQRVEEGPAMARRLPEAARRQPDADRQRRRARSPTASSPPSSRCCSRSRSCSTASAS